MVYYKCGKINKLQDSTNSLKWRFDKRIPCRVIILKNVNEGNKQMGRVVKK